MTIPALTPEDDLLHPASDHWWETETAWFSFNVPERRIGCWFYNQILATQGVCNGGVWVWDDSAAGALYEVRHEGLPLDAASVDLRDVTLPNGNHLEVLEPLTRYSRPVPRRRPVRGRPRVRRHHGAKLPSPRDGAVLEGPPLRPADARHRHRPPVRRGDRGRLLLDPRSLGGPRPMGPDPRKDPSTPRPPRPPRPPEGIGYPFATASPTESWLLYTRPTIVEGVASDELSTGYLLRGGVYGHLVEGRRRTWLDPTTR